MEQHQNVVDNSVKIGKSLWNYPNTAIGATWGAVGLLQGAEYNYDPDTGVHEVTKHPQLGVISNFLFPLIGISRGGAISLGEVVNYMGDRANPSMIITSAYATFSDENGNKYKPKIILGAHENKHVEQSRSLGPIYLPTYLYNGALSGNNWMEIEANKAGSEALKKKEHER